MFEPFESLRSKEILDQLFDFYFAVDHTMQIILTGSSIERMLPAKKSRDLRNYIRILAPKVLQFDFESIRKEIDTPFQIELQDGQATKLRGRFQFLKQGPYLLFSGAAVGDYPLGKLSPDSMTGNRPGEPEESPERSTSDSQIEALQKQVSELSRKMESERTKDFKTRELAQFTLEINDPILRLDSDGVVLIQNPASEKLHHFYYQDKAYRSGTFWPHIATIIDRSAPEWTFEAESQYRFFSFTCKYQAQGNYFNIFGKDVTAKKKADKEIERLALVASANKNGVVFTRTDGRISWFNESFTRMTGFTLEEAMGKTLIELCRGPLTDKETLGLVLDNFYSGREFLAKIIFYRKDGSWFWGRSTPQPIRNADGVTTGYFGIIEDITPQKEQDEKIKILSQIAEDNVNPVIIADRLGLITWVNKSFTRLTGYSLEEAIGKKPGSLLQGPETDPATVRAIGISIGRGEAFGGEIINYSKTGRKYWLRIQGQPVKNERGEVTGYFAIEEDITKEKESESRFRTALEKIGDNVWEHDFKTGKTSISKSNNEILGYPMTEDVDYRNLWWSQVYPEDLPILKEIDEKYRQGIIDSHTLEYRVYRGDGQIRWVLDRGVVIGRDSQNAPLTITGTHTDITGRKNAEQRMEEQRKFYEDILNTIPSDIAVFNARHEYLFINPGGIKDPEIRKWIIGKTDEAYCRYRNKPMYLVQQREEAFQSVLRTKNTTEWEENLIAENGQREYYLRRMVPVLNNKGEVYLVIGYGFNLTERKHLERVMKANEEKYRSIIANMNLGLMETDSQGRISFANQSMLTMAGLSEQEAIGYDAGLLISGDRFRLKETQEADTLVNEAFEVRLQIGEKPKWWLVSMAAKGAGLDHQGGSIWICLDITERKGLEEELIRSREMAEQMARAKEIFLANMSHEIRTPMNAIMGMGNQLEKTSLTDQQENYLRIINTAAQNLLVIINDILDLSKIEAGKLSVERIGFDLKKVIHNAMQVLIPRAEEKGLQFTNSRTAGKLAEILIGDPFRLTQVLLNLLSNAIKFTEKGSVDISYDLLRETPHTQVIRFEITDTGIGMDPEFVSRIFHKFNQEYESISRQFGGTGLGMAISKQLIELMHGEIEVNSLKGKGTLVTFIIEFSRGSQLDLPLERKEAITMDFLKGKSILVADDNEMNRLVAIAILENYGARIIAAENGEEALHELGRQHVDLILMDIQMPKMNGYEATSRIRNSGNPIPIVALTANAIKGESEKCIRAGMNDYISKPFKEADFLKVISHWLNADPNTDIDSIVEKPIEISLYNLSTLREVARGNDAFVDKMIQVFCDQTPELTTRMKEAFLNGDLRTMGEIAHKIKPSVDHLQIESLKTPIRAIEKAGKNETTTPGLPGWIEDTVDIISKVVESLQITHSKTIQL